MIIDFREADPGSDLHADLCIVGSGAAGITIARELAGSGAKVIVLESGGLEFEQEIQDLYEGENAGLYYSLTANRLRFFGGTTNHWGGLCSPLSEIDFRARSWVPNSGWPISRDDLVPYYKKAQKICGLARFFYADDVWQNTELKPPALDPAKIRYGFRQLSDPPVRFGKEFRDDLANAANIQVLLHANVVNIHQSPDGQRVERVDLRTLQGKTGRVSARYFVLACGALENARLLLVSNAQEPAGVGNRNDVVGRYFIEHPQFWVGLAFPKNLEDLRAALAPEVDGVRFMPHFTASPEAQERDGILNSIIYLNEVLMPYSGVMAARDIMKALRSDEEDLTGLDEKIWHILMDLDQVAVNAWRRFVLHRSTLPPIERLELRIESEQVPFAESRVTLLRQKDALGLNRLRLKWLLAGDQERQTAVYLGKLVAAEFGRLGLGRVKLDEKVLYWKDPSKPHCICHQMGTTRMSDDPKKGVVDRNCLVHGLGNFYVTGSSVFPTGGGVNPTLTVVAMALRLSDHLKSRLG